MAHTSQLATPGTGIGARVTGGQWRQRPIVTGEPPPMIRRLSRRAAFLRGVASAFDLSARSRRPVVLPDAEEALAGDWRAVGGDLRAAIDRYAAERR